MFVNYFLSVCIFRANLYAKETFHLEARSKSAVGSIEEHPVHSIVRLHQRTKDPALAIGIQREPLIIFNSIFPLDSLRLHS